MSEFEEDYSKLERLKLSIGCSAFMFVSWALINLFAYWAFGEYSAVLISFGVISSVGILVYVWNATGRGIDHDFEG